MDCIVTGVETCVNQITQMGWDMLWYHTPKIELQAPEWHHSYSLTKLKKFKVIPSTEKAMEVVL